MLPKISIITPSFNQACFLEQTIDSVLSQNYSNLEYIIIDGGSDDGSVEIIKKYEKYLHYWVSEKDQGQSHAINKGIKYVNGEVFNWLNSDDYYFPNALQYVGQFFKDNPTKNVLAGGCEVFNSATDIVYLSKGTQLYDSLEKTIGKAFIEQPSTFFRTTSIKRIGGLNNSLHFLMDKEMWIRYLLHFDKQTVMKVDKLFVRFRHHENSKTVSQIDRFQNEEDCIFLSLSQQFKLNDYTFIISNFSPGCVSYSGIKIKDNLGLDFVKKVLNYYLLHRADVFYFNGDRKSCSKILEFISKDLSEEEAKLIKKLTFRSSLLGSFMVSIFKKFIR